MHILKFFKGKGVHTSLMLQTLISASGHVILNVYETTVTYMVSVNINDIVQHSDITFDHNV